MSYHIGPSPAPQSLVPAIQPHHYRLLPLSQVSPESATPLARIDPGTKRVLIIIGILLLAVIVFAMLSRKGASKEVSRNPVKRLSTPELAKNLYERLDRRGGASETTLRSLKAYASKR